MTSGLGASFGSDPAEYAWNRAPPICRKIASAMIERAELCVQRNSTLKAGVMDWSFSGKGGSNRPRSPHSSGFPPQQVSVRNVSNCRRPAMRTA